MSTVYLDDFSTVLYACGCVCVCVYRPERKDFILSKYQDAHFVRRKYSSTAALRLGLQEATKSCDIYGLIQLYAQRAELSQPLHMHIQV